MNGLDFRRYALGSCVAVAVLAGCGGSQPPIGAPEFFSAAHEARVLNPDIREHSRKARRVAYKDKSNRG
jgi:hypothetical protein